MPSIGMSRCRALSDGELTGLLPSGCRDALAEIYERYKGLLYIPAFNKLRDEDEASDIVHDLFCSPKNPT